MVALYNLVSNALKYTPEKGAIAVRLAVTDGGVSIEVRDTGTGIPEAIGDRLFDKFYQFRTSEMTSISGFGIGLYLVKQFVDAHRGKITYESAKDKGTTFRVLLPTTVLSLSPAAAPTAGEATTGLSALVREIAEETPEEANDDQEGRADTGAGVGPGDLVCPEVFVTDRRSLLVVDDDPQLLNYVCGIFETHFILYQALNGEDGITLARKHHPDLIISDLHMDGISGIEMCETIKNDPALGMTPVILLTASTSANYKLEGVKHGADDYITKPFDRDLLIARVGGPAR